MSFDPDKALKYARAISYPRRVGTEGEKEAASAISGWFSDAGYEVTLHRFRFTDAFDNVIKLEILLGQLLILAGVILGRENPEISFLIAIVVILLIGIYPIIHRVVLRDSVFNQSEEMTTWKSMFVQRLGRQYQTANIMASLPRNGLEARRPRLVLMAHYDTKSQPISLTTRMALFVLVIAGAIGFSLLTLIGIIFPSMTQVATIFGILAILAGIPLLFLNVGNKSPGALDNASGVGLLVHLAEIMAQESGIQEKLDLEFIVTSAEEFALMGARAFLNEILNHSPVADGKMDFYLLNFDGIAGEGTLNLSGRSGEAAIVGSLIQDCCAANSIPLARINLPALMMDHMPFAREGLDAVSLTSLGRPALAVHTPKDKVERLSASAMAQAGQAAVCLVNQLSGKE